MHFPSQVIKSNLINPRAGVSCVKICQMKPQFQFTIYTQESSSNPEFSH